MKSTAHFKGHPIHPMLVPFPIAFFIGTLIFDLLAWVFTDADFYQTAKFLALSGIIAALLTAIPGLIDYFYTVPPNSTGKTRATKHGLINLTVVLVFVVVYFYRQGENVLLPVLLGLELLGLVLLTISGWMGGTLVYRNQIGVNPRTARAGKWKGIYLKDAKGKVEVARKEDLKVDQMLLLHINGERIALGRTEEAYVAFEDRCSHRGGSLAGGMMICGTVQCPWHGSQFNLSSGEVKAGPAEEKIKIYKVLEEGGKVYLMIS